MAQSHISSSLDHFYMQRALVLAKRGLGWTNPNPLVGCVVVKDHQIIGEGWHKALGQPHAEIEALNTCLQSTQGATLYVTLTPCNHMGRTPPCTQAIISAGIMRVVIAAHDPTGHAKESITLLKQHGIQITTDIFAKEAKALNPAFYHHADHASVYVHTKWAMSLDGRMAVQPGDTPQLSSQKSLNQSHAWRQYCDAILVGVNTIIHDNPQLTVRYLEGDIKFKHPIRIILDPHGRTPLTSFVFNHTANTVFITGESVASTFERGVIESGHAIKKYILNDLGLLPLPKILKDLYQEGIGSILLEGGQITRDIFLAQGLVHGMSVCVTPFTIGCVENVKKKKWFLQQHQMFNEDCYLTYQ